MVRFNPRVWLARAVAPADRFNRWATRLFVVGGR